MFWISRRFQSRIERATLSGGNKKTLVNFNGWFPPHPNEITIDFSANRLYWVDTYRTIESIDFNGNNKQNFKTLPFGSSPNEIVLHNGVFYLSDSSSHVHVIDRIDQATKQSLGSYTGLGSSSVLGIAMFSPLQQPKGKNKIDITCNESTSWEIMSIYGVKLSWIVNVLTVSDLHVGYLCNMDRWLFLRLTI